MSRLAGVCGSPVRHSLSPVIHGAWLAAAGIDGRYERFEVEPGGLGGFVAANRDRLSGLNVTVPHKEDALALADVRSPAAQAAGAANVLVFREGGIFADNTDGVGLLAALSEQAQFSPAGKSVLLLGAGGAARGAAAALLAAGARVRVLNRSEDRALALAASPELSALGYIEALRGELMRAALAQADLVVNATTLGLGGGPGPEVDLGLTPAGCVVMDMVYKPLRTEFLAVAERLGRPTVDGLAMLIGQAFPSFEAFFGQAPDPRVDVRALALAELGETP